MTKRIKVNLLAFCTICIWASAFPLTRVVGEYVNPFQLGSLRCLIATVFLILLKSLFKGEKAQIDKNFQSNKVKRFLWFILLSISGFGLYIILFNFSMQSISSATSSVIIALTPVMTAIGAAKIYGEKINKIGWICVSSAFVGVVVLLLWNGIFSINIGLIYCLFASVLFCIYNLINRLLGSKGYLAIDIVTHAIAGAAFMLAIFLPGALETLVTLGDVKVALIVIYLGMMPSATAYFVWAKAISMADKTSEVTNYMFVTPLLSTLLGFLINGEIVDMSTIIGGLIILISVIVFGIKGK